MQTSRKIGIKYGYSSTIAAFLPNKNPKKYATNAIKMKLTAIYSLAIIGSSVISAAIVRNLEEILIFCVYYASN